MIRQITMNVKNIFNYLFLKGGLGIVCCLCTLAGCDEYDFNMPVSPFLQIGEEAVSFEQKGGEHVLEVRCNEEYVIQPSQGLEGWCTISKLASGDLQLTVAANEGKNIRKGEFYVVAKSQADTISVAQLGYARAMLVSNNNFNIREAGDKFQVDITANVAYVFEMDDWIKELPAARAASESVTTTHHFMVQGNKGTKRTGRILIKDVDEESDVEPTYITIVQRGLDTYDPEAPKEGEDIKLVPSSAEGDGGVPGGSYEAMFDNDMETNWQANWKAPIGLIYPQYIEFTFDEKVDMDYMVYRCNWQDNRMKDVKVEVLTDVNASRSADYVTVFEGTLPNSAASRIDFNASQSGVTKVKMTIATCYNMGKPLRCNEMEFYQKDPSAFKYSDLFTNPACTDLKPNVSEEDILNCTNAFYKNLAWFMYNGKYQREFRIADYKAYPHPDVQAKINKTAPYSLLDNPTGIFVTKGENLVVMADLKGRSKVNIRVQNLDQPGKDGFGGDEYTVVDGVNTLKIKEKGLVYVMYHTDNYETAPAITLHFASGKVNGYYDKENPVHAGRWKELLNASVDTHFDVLGKYVHLTFTTLSFLNYTKDVDALIDLYDNMIFRQQEFLGLTKYDRMFKNRSYFHVIYNSDAFMYATSYHTAYIESTLSYLADEKQFAANCWGPAHELGHIHQTRPGLKWIGLTEVSNNITALYVQTSVFGEKSRMEVQGHYAKAWNGIMLPRKAHAVETEPFSKLIPFWQLELYFGRVLGHTPMQQADHGGFYPDVYEYVRTNDDLSTDGKRQLEFVYNCSKAGKTNLLDFFEKWGFLTLVDEEIKDYTNSRMTITQADIDALKQRVEALGYAKPNVALEYITDNTVELYRNKVSVVVGSAVREGNTLTMNNWKNVVVFEVKDGKGNLVYVAEGAEPSSSVCTFTLPSDWKNDYAVSAVSATGERTVVSIK